MPPESGSGSRIAELDGLRGLAASAVVLFHYFYDGCPEGFLRNVLASGWTGVDLFFVLSGFLIVGILVDVKESPRFYQTFYARRAFRILPIYLVLIGVVYLALELFVRTYYGEKPQAWIYLLFLQNFWSLNTGLLPPEPLTVTWSLAIEEQAYLLLPLIVRNTSRRTLAIALCTMVMVLPFLRLLMVQNGLTIAGYVTRFDPLLMGGLCALAVRSERARAALVSNPGRMRLILAALGVAFVVLMSLRTRIPTASLDLLMNAGGYTVLGAFYSALLLNVLLHPSGHLGALLRTPVMRSIGSVSYGLYLFHQVVWFGFTRILERFGGGSDSLGARVAALVITGMLAAASFRWFEKPLLDKGHRFRY